MQFDIIIIGGGMVGAAMASALRKTSYKIALIDSSPLNVSDDHRLIALNYSSICAFKNLAIWPKVLPHASAIHEVHVSQRGQFGATRLNADDVNLDSLGYVIPAKYINATLNENLSHITLIRPATLKTLTQNDEGATVTLETPQGTKTLSAKIIIGADGTHSTVRNLLNIATSITNYHQTALVTTTQLHRGHNHIAYERFQEKGAIAMLPLVNDHVATIWTGDTEYIHHLLKLTDDEFLALLQKQFGYRLGRFKKTTPRYSYPLQMLQAASKVKERVILIGNAAHTLHPIAAQGLNLAIFEIAALADYFKEHDLDTLSLNDFAMDQQKNSTSLSHNLVRFFSHDFFLMNTARKIGMIGLDLCQPAKEHFIWQSLGRKGRIPTLLREQDTHETLSS